MPPIVEQDILFTSSRKETAPRSWPPETEEHRTRAPEYYGFVSLTSTYFLFVIYLLWALLPDRYIIATGITWYPSREWAILVPSWTVVLVILTYVTYSALALLGTPAFREIHSVADSRVALPTELNIVEKDGSTHNPYIAAGDPQRSIPELYDLPIGLVNRVLYHKELAHNARSQPS